jgi:hypothetical protein
MLRESTNGFKKMIQQKKLNDQFMEYLCTIYNYIESLKSN